MAKKKTSARRKAGSKAKPRSQRAAKPNVVKKTKTIEVRLPDEISYHYIKANQFRVIHADGAHGGVTPRGHIQMALFSERRPIPQLTVQRLNKDGSLGEEFREKRVEKEGLVREVEVEVIMTIETATTLRDWLRDRIESLERMRQAVEASR